MSEPTKCKHDWRTDADGDRVCAKCGTMVDKEGKSLNVTMATFAPPPDPTTERANLRRLAEAATPGPWVNAGYYSDENIGPHIAGPGDVEITIVVSDREDADAAYIAAANPQAVLGLLDEIDRLTQGGCARDQRTTQFCAEVVERDRMIRELRARIEALERGWADTRDIILNERHQLAEEDFGSERINMVLGVLDDNYPTLPAERSES